MAPTKLIDRGSPTVVTNGATIPQRASRLPPTLRFPIIVTLYFFINTTLWSVVANFLGTELGNATKIEDDGYYAATRLVYKIFMLWFTWKANYDWIDVGALTVLNSSPFAYILSTYYEVSVGTVAAFMNIEVLAIAIPTLLLRPRSKLHNPNAPLRNRFLLESFQVQTAASLLAVGVYVTVLYTSIKTGVLNVFLISHFDIPTLEGAHAENPISLVAKVLTTGIAARAFLLNPSIGAEPATGAGTPVEPFDAATADLPATLKHNFWFWSKRTRTLIRQTGVLCLFVFANTVVRATTLRGSDIVGAVGYSAIWIFATVVYAGWLVWVGDTEA